MVSCILALINILFADDFNENRHTICKHCKTSCKQTEYVTTTSQSTFPSYSVPSTLSVFGDVTFEREAFFYKLTYVKFISI